MDELPTKQMWNENKVVKMALGGTPDHWVGHLTTEWPQETGAQ